MKIRVNRIHFYIAIIMVAILMYIYMQNALEFKEISTKSVQLVIIVLCFLCVCPHMSKVPELLFCGILLATAISFAIFINATADTDLIYCLSKAFFWVLVMWMSYVATRYHAMAKAYLNIFMSALLLLCSVYATSLQTDYSISNKDYTLTSVYYIFCFLPFTLHIKQNRWRHCLIVLMCALVFVSFKRSAILTLSCVMILLFFMDRKKLSTRSVVISAVGVVLAGVLLMMMYSSSIISHSVSLRDIISIWIGRFNAGNSIRRSIYSEVISLQLRSGVLQWLVGHGYNAVQNVTSSGLSAHNDFLEILYDYGIIVFGIYLGFIWLLIRKCMAMKKRDEECYKGMSVSVAIFVLVSIPSHMLTYSTYFIIIAAYWGFAIGLENRNIMENKLGDQYENRNYNIPQSI